MSWRILASCVRFSTLAVEVPCSVERNDAASTGPLVKPEDKGHGSSKSRSIRGSWD
ncbi:uncharacterized protein [Physcomitrium patens]|uniref:uncharacterized protein isoform X2 n=1 Tax=Physcomitrium patens TaxID=3218 RepID=UPI003CCE1D40